MPLKADPAELLKDQFGAAWGGQREFTDRLLHGVESIHHWLILKYAR